MLMRTKYSHFKHRLMRPAEREKDLRVVVDSSVEGSNPCAAAEKEAKGLE